MQKSVNVVAAANRAAHKQLRVYAFAVEVAASVRENNRSTPIEWSSRPTVPSPTPPLETVGAATSSLTEVMACIRDAESGNYSESSHLDAGSGAYQYVPSTWQTWAASAGYSGYAYAYQAPAEVQDAVTEYVLTHGGAHNWDPSFGADSCTVGMP